MSALPVYIETENPITLALSHKMVDGFPVTIVPPGCAAGCFEIRSRGKGPDYMLVNRWPSNTHFRLTTGGERKWRTIQYGPLCFQQELYVYHRELGATMQLAFDALKTEIADEMHDLVCAHCAQEFQSTRKKKYCSASCCMKAQAWKLLKRQLDDDTIEEIRAALAGRKLKIAKERNHWRIRGLDAEGTYTTIKKRFRTFESAKEFATVSMQRVAHERTAIAAKGVA